MVHYMKWEKDIYQSVLKPMIMISFNTVKLYWTWTFDRVWCWLHFNSEVFLIKSHNHEQDVRHIPTEGHPYRISQYSTSKVALAIIRSPRNQERKMWSPKTENDSKVWFISCWQQGNQSIISFINLKSFENLQSILKVQICLLT